MTTPSSASVASELMMDEPRPRERHLPDRLSLIRRVQVSCGCIRAVDKISGQAVMERECRRARP